MLYIEILRPEFFPIHGSYQALNENFMAIEAVTCVDVWEICTMEVNTML